MIVYKVLRVALANNSVKTTNPLLVATLKRNIATAADATSWHTLLPRLQEGAGTGLAKDPFVNHTADWIEVGPYKLKEEGNHYHVLRGAEWMNLKGGGMNLKGGGRRSRRATRKSRR